MKRLIESTHCIGFTGTDLGMTEKQKHGIEACLAFAFLPGAEFHHGDCIEADEQAAAMAKSIGYIIVAHPGCDHRGKSPKRAYYPGNDRILTTYPYMRRNQHIVNAVAELYAAPSETTEQLYSGTWSTIRKGRKKGIYVGIVGPNGEHL